MKFHKWTQQQKNKGPYLTNSSDADIAASLQAINQPLQRIRELVSNLDLKNINAEQKKELEALRENLWSNYIEAMEKMGMPKEILAKMTTAKLNHMENPQELQKSVETVIKELRGSIAARRLNFSEIENSKNPAVMKTAEKLSEEIKVLENIYKGLESGYKSVNNIVERLNRTTFNDNAEKKNVLKSMVYPAAEQICAGFWRAVKLGNTSGDYLGKVGAKVGFTAGSVAAIPSLGAAGIFTIPA